MLALYCPGIRENAPTARAQRETYWRRLIARWQLSGLPKATFSEREQISRTALHRWFRELARRDGLDRSSAPQQSSR